MGLIVKALVMLLAILMFTGIGVIAAGNSCTIKDNFKSPYVIPQYEQTSAPHGCASRTLGHGSKEVRAVNYISQGSNSAPVEIKLHLEPLKLITGLFINKLVIILSSTHPITWRVSTRQISNQTKQLFVLSPGSRLLKDSRIRTKVLKSDEMPNNSLLLFDWIKNKYGAVTSLAEVSQINRIVQSVGIDDRLPNECDFEKSSKSTAIQVSKIQLQPMKGCAFPPDRSREVHIIEVHRASTYPLADSAFTTTVDVRIRSKNVAVAVRKSLVIVLKGYSGLNWKLSSQNIYSSINVIGTGDIDTSGIAAGASVKSSVETVGEFGDKLVTFVKQRFGAVTSYTDVTLANMIELVIDPAGKKLTRSPFSHPQQTLSAIRDVMALSCYRSGLKVSLPKKSAREIGVLKDHLTLSNAMCVAVDNGTHFVLSAMITNCGTLEVTRKNSPRFVNSLVLHRLASDDAIINEEGSGYQNDDGNHSDNGEMIADQTYIDDEDFSVKAMSIKFHCEKKASLPQSTSLVNNPFGSQLGTFHRSLGESDDSYYLRIYKDEEFRNHVYVFPQSVLDGDRVYVEAKLEFDKPDVHVRAMIHSCWLAENLNKKAKRHVLIDTGCRTDVSVKWHTEAEDENLVQLQRFSFRVGNYFNTPYSFLTCQLSMCSEKGIFKAPKVKKCMSQSDYCLDQNKNIGTEKAQPVVINNDMKILTLGPLQVNSADSGMPFLTDPSKGVFGGQSIGGGNKFPRGPMGNQNNRSPHGENSGQGNLDQTGPIIVQGLDSGTVVGIAFAAFIIGVLLTASLWFIHTHTGPSRKKNKVKNRRRGESSGESTPSSTVPMAV